MISRRAAPEKSDIEQLTQLVKLTLSSPRYISVVLTVI